MTLLNHHLTSPRLFDLSQVGAIHSTVILNRQEQEHLRGCPECQTSVEIFTRELNREAADKEKLWAISKAFAYSVQVPD